MPEPGRAETETRRDGGTCEYSLSTPFGSLRSRCRAVAAAAPHERGAPTTVARVPVRCTGGWGDLHHQRRGNWPAGLSARRHSGCSRADTDGQHADTRSAAREVVQEGGLAVARLAGLAR